MKEENGKIDPLNSMCENFWSDHFKVFGFVRLFITVFIDFIEDKMKSPELSMVIAGYYLIGLNSQLLGIFEAQGMCQPLYPNHISVPEYLLLDKNIFSKYSHYFYPLVFLGNLNRASFFLTLFCACYCWYDFVLDIVDVFII